MRLVDSDVDQRTRPRIGICDGDSAEWFAAADKRIALVLIVFIFIEVDVEGSTQALRFDTRVMEKAFGDIAVVVRSFENFASSVSGEGAPCSPRFIAFGVASEIGRSIPRLRSDGFID